jgi:hypothetical protein
MPMAPAVIMSFRNLPDAGSEHAGNDGGDCFKSEIRHVIFLKRGDQITSCDSPSLTKENKYSGKYCNKLLLLYLVLIPESEKIIRRYFVFMLKRFHLQSHLLALWHLIIFG